MPTRALNPNNLGQDEDWECNAAAFTCPICRKVFIVSGTRIHRGQRICPGCNKSVGHCDIKGKKSGGKASIEW